MVSNPFKNIQKNSRDKLEGQIGSQPGTAIPGGGAPGQLHKVKQLVTGSGFPATPRALQKVGESGRQ